MSGSSAERVPYATGDWRDVLAFLEPLADSLECGVMLIDGERRIVLASGPLAAMFGLTIDGLKAMTPETFVDYVATLVDDPPQLLRDRRILPPDAPIVCEEFALARPSRSVVCLVSNQRFARVTWNTSG